MQTGSFNQSNKMTRKIVILMIKLIQSRNYLQMILRNKNYSKKLRNSDQILTKSCSLTKVVVLSNSTGAVLEMLNG